MKKTPWPNPEYANYKKVKYPKLKDGDLDSFEKHKCSYCGKIEVEALMKFDPKTNKWYDSSCYVEWECYGELPELPTTSQNQEQIKQLENRVAELERETKELKEQKQEKAETTTAHIVQQDKK